MGYADCWSALNLEMPPVIPRTEYSLESHWGVLSAIAGRTISAGSPADERWAAQRQLYRTWDYGFLWSILVGGGHIQGRRTDMGHAVYDAGGADFRPASASPFAGTADVLAYDPEAEAGTWDPARAAQAFQAHWEGQQAEDIDALRMSGTYVTLFSGLIEVFGWDLLLAAAGEDAEGLGAVAGRWERWMRPFFEGYADTTIPVMMVHDDLTWTSGPVLRPAWYRRYIFPAYRRLFRPVIEAGKKIIFTCDGDYTAFFPDVVDAGVHGLVMEPCADMAAFARRYGRTHAFVGNADTRILLSGSPAGIEAEVERCIAIGRDCPGFIMAVGNHIPANTPLENVLRYQEAFARRRRR